MADSFVGEIRIFAGNYAPVDWLLCDGSVLSIAQYQSLYALIGVTYGGNGVTTFALPNLNGQLPIGQGTGSGLVNRVIGEKTGVASVTLASAELPIHTHAIQATTNLATTPTPGPTLTLATISAPSVFYDGGTSTPATQKAFNAEAFTPTGGNAAHNNMMPTLSLSYIIATSGTYPTPS
ncbi:phage tail protein [Undibacterium rugosum]|uniref:phage tail protein n=1 Tax=Undibacterium rugosum TaxID=2762291 RepID=UPI001B83A92B|nr:tail fiber protein [Undibacterium rugosum]MBR7780108.1 phage tail protein [Undibacterium rugosum]